MTSIKFIQANNNDWCIFDDTNIPELTNDIPVITCVGTSRDGKSTLLNVFANWLINKNKSDSDVMSKLYFWKDNSKTFFNPFVSSDGDDVVTDGMDYFLIPKKCMLIDCQGFQLKSAKNDHYLMLMTYLMSNIIILNVRQKLDLQVFNNLLPAFGFLNELPQESKKKDKPILLIRIKDYQNFKEIDKNKNYLELYLQKWLQKENDQYDELKDVMKNMFDIKIIATAMPKMNDYNEINIDNSFFQNNPTFEKLCEYLYKLSYNLQPTDIMKNKILLKQIINELKMNKNIDFKSLDFYKNLTENQIYKFLQEFIPSSKYHVLSDTLLINDMNGSNLSYNKYTHRKELREELYELLYNQKFATISTNIKSECFNNMFQKYDDIIEQGKQKNISLAYQKIENARKIFMDKFDIDINDNFDIFCTGLYEHFIFHKNMFIDVLENIDMNVKDEMLLMIENDEEKICELQKKINMLNDIQCNIIKDDIIKNDPVENIKAHIGIEICDDIHRGKYNMQMNDIIERYLHKLSVNIKDICMLTKGIYHSNKKLEITTSVNDYKNINMYMPENIIDILTNYYWEAMEKEFSSLGFIPNGSRLSGSENLDMNINSNIEFVSFNFGENDDTVYQFTMTKKVFNGTKFIEKISEFLKSEKIPFDLRTKELSNKCTHYNISLLHIHQISTSFCEFEKIWYNGIFKFLLNYCAENNFKYSSNHKHNMKCTNTYDSKIEKSSYKSSKISPDKNVAKKTRQHVPQPLKAACWNKWIGRDNGIAKCFCCNLNEITQLNFQAGHIISQHDGGEMSVDNLRPVCGSCNSSMGKKNMEKFIETYQLRKV